MRIAARALQAQWWAGVVEPVVIDIPPPSIDGWYQRPSEPVRRLPPRHLYQTAASGAIEVTLFTTPAFGWHRPQSEPLRTVRYPVRTGESLWINEPSLLNTLRRADWYQQPSEPLRITPRPLVGTVFASIVEPSVYATPSITAWYQPTSVPIRPLPRYAGLTNWRGENREPTVYTPPPDISWWCQPSEPIRRLPPRVPGLGGPVFGANPADTANNDNLRIEWWVQASEPVRGTKYAPPWAGQYSRPLEPSIVLEPTPLSWWRPASEPVRVVRQPLRTTWFVGDFSQVTDFVPVLGFIQPSEPIRKLPPRVPGLGSDHVAPVDPYSAFHDFLFDHYRPPAFIFRRPYLHPVGGSFEPLDPTLRVVPDISWYWRQPSEPVRTLPPRVPGIGTDYVWPLEDTLYSTPTLPSWWRQPSERIRTISPRVPGLGTDYVGPIEATLWTEPVTISWWREIVQQPRRLPPSVPPGPYWVFVAHTADIAVTGTSGGTWYVGPQSLTWQSEGRGTTWHTTPGTA